MAKKKKLSKAVGPPVKRARQARLPEMDDPKIEELESLAQDYASIRDQRQALTAQEGPLKQNLLNLMKSQKRDHYKRNGIEIRIVNEKENVKVKVKKADEYPD
jgi:hypothetical protein